MPAIKAEPSEDLQTQGKYTNYITTQVLLVVCVVRTTFHSLTMGAKTQAGTLAHLKICAG